MNHYHIGITSLCPVPICSQSYCIQPPSITIAAAFFSLGLIFDLGACCRLLKCGLLFPACCTGEIVQLTLTHKDALIYKCNRTVLSLARLRAAIAPQVILLFLRPSSASTKTSEPGRMIFAPWPGLASACQCFVLV